MVDPDQDLEQERSADYQVYTVSGSHQEIGRAMAARAAALRPSADQLPPDRLAFARACRAEVARVYPPLVEEIDAYAEGAGRSPDEILWHYAPVAAGPPPASPPPSRGSAPPTASAPPAPPAAPEPPANCSSVGLLTGDGPVVARNYDFFHWENRRHLVTTRPQAGLAHTGMWTGLAGGRYDGVNAARLWVAIHGGGTRLGGPAPGICFHHACRIVLETCTSAQEAVEMLLGLPHLAPYNYFVADSRDMFVVEAHPSRARVREAVDGVLACTNHPLHPEMVDLTQSPILENSRARMAFLLSAARQARRAYEERPAADPREAAETAEALAAAMRDHTVPVCGHTDGLATFWSALCIPGREQVAYSLGAPCRNEYAPARWPGGNAREARR